MRELQQGTDYGSISTILADEERAQILYLGGWNQNFDLMVAAQREMAWLGLSSVGMNAFDTVPAAVNLEPELSYFGQETDPLLQEIPARMRARATNLNELWYTTLCQNLQPTAVMTHCAGANVLLAACLQPENGLPKHGILIEPTIAENMTRAQYIELFRQHENAAKHDPALISLRALSAQTAARQSVAERTLPIDDIVNSRGITLLTKVLATGANYRTVVGANDYAANAETLSASFRAADLEPPIMYEHQARFGHGYFLAEAPRALITIAPLLGELAVAA